jgi:hypothetical protein
MNIVQGDLFVGINPNSSETDTTLSITMQASNTNLFQQTRVCSTVATNLTNLSISVCRIVSLLWISCKTHIKQIPDNLALVDQLLFNITLLYPQSPIPARVGTFATFLPLFTQTFGDFGDYVTFRKVSIEGPVSKIFVDVSHYA